MKSNYVQSLELSEKGVTYEFALIRFGSMHQLVIRNLNTRKHHQTMYVDSDQDSVVDVIRLDSEPKLFLLEVKALEKFGFNLQKVKHLIEKE